MNTRNTQRTWLGFTLIELMVVVALISILAVVVSPAAFRRFQEARKASTGDVNVAQIDSETDQDNESYSLPIVEQAVPLGLLPEIESAKFDLRVEANQEQRGVQVFTSYRTKVTGELRLIPPTDGDAIVLLQVPFPVGMEDVEELSLTLDDGSHEDSRLIDDLEITAHDFHWSGKLVGEQPAELVVARYNFTAIGNDRFELQLPTARRIGQVEILANVNGLPMRRNIDGALTPKQQSANEVRWTYENLVSTRPLVIDFEVPANPIDRAWLLYKLAGVAVLLFGAGFKYLGEVYRPGRLDSFHFSHFLLLSLIYCFFFAVFGVLSYRGLTPTVSIPVSVLMALPLLALHISTIFDRQFALTRAVPLALWTFAVVAGGVYGGEYRTYLYLGLAFIAVALLTLTFRKLLAQQRQRRETQEAELEVALAALKEPVEIAASLADEAGLMLEEHGPHTPEARRVEVEARLETIQENMRAHEHSTLQYQEMLTMTSMSQRKDRCEYLAGRAEVLQSELLHSTAPLRSILDKLERGRARAQKQEQEKLQQQLVEHVDGDRHCLCCGDIEGNSRYCPGCGKPTSRKIECRRCKDVLQLPLHLLRDEVRVNGLHCASCGAPHHGAVSV